MKEAILEALGHELSRLFPNADLGIDEPYMDNISCGEDYDGILTLVHAALAPGDYAISIVDHHGMACWEVIFNYNDRQAMYEYKFYDLADPTSVEQIIQLITDHVNTGSWPE